jgi:hypothetical protein
MPPQVLGIHGLALLTAAQNSGSSSSAMLASGRSHMAGHFCAATCIKKLCAAVFSTSATIRAAPGLGFDLGERVAGSQRVRTLLLSPRCGDCRPEEYAVTTYPQSPFYSAVFLRCLQKMIRSPRGRPTDAERAIERLLGRLVGPDDRCANGQQRGSDGAADGQRGEFLKR